MRDNILRYISFNFLRCDRQQALLRSGTTAEYGAHCAELSSGRAAAANYDDLPTRSRSASSATLASFALWVPRGTATFCHSLGATAGALHARAFHLRAPPLLQVSAFTCPEGRGVAPSITQALSHVIKTEGVRSLWKGNAVTIVHRLPYSAINFSTYEQTSRCAALPAAMFARGSVACDASTST